MRALVILVLASSLVGCNRKQAPSATSTQPASSTATPTPAAAPAPSGSTGGAAAPAGENLLSLASGAFVVHRASAVDANGAAWFLFDEDPRTGFTSADGQWNAASVVELADRSLIRTLVLDTARVELDARIPSTIEIAVSDTSATDGFETIATISPAAEPRDGQSFPVAAPKPGRWVRVRIVAMREGGTTGFAQLMELRGFGDRLTHRPDANVTGTYEQSDYGPFHLKQEGTTITGCMGADNRPIVGGVQGRVVQFTWNTEYDTGPTVAIVSDDGALFGGWWKVGGASDQPAMNPFEGRRTSTDPGQCPAWNTPEDPLAAELKRSGRVRLYGIQFDSDSDRLCDDSKSTLDRLVAILRSDATLALTIEGHTDSTSTPAHNQDLSDRRAAAVKRYLVDAGIDASRLGTAGFGATRPIATNDSSLGRAANRRVELARR